MESVARFLASRDREVRLAAVRLLSSKFQTNPSEVVLNFPHFLPSFEALLADRSSLAFPHFAARLVDLLATRDFELTPAAVASLLHFFRSCFEFSPDSRRSDAFALGAFDPAQIHGALGRVLAAHAPLDHLAALFGILVASQSPKVLRFVEPLAGALLALVAARPAAFLPDLLKCLASAAPPICVLAADTLAALAGDDAVLLRLLPLAGLVRARAAELEAPGLARLLAALGSAAFLRRVLAQPRDPAAVPAGGRAPAEERFLAADFAREEAPDGARRQAAARPAAPASLSKRLASELPAQAQPDRASVLEAADGDAAPLPRADGIVAVVHELGGFQRGTWQRRVFEYHPLSKCVVWRKSRQAPVKGFLLVSPELEVERVAKGVKGRPFVMEISAFSKVRQIAFETQWELDRWLVTLEAARVQQ